MMHQDGQQTNSRTPISANEAAERDHAMQQQQEFHILLKEMMYKVA